jgi:hypothetical protein
MTGSGKGLIVKKEIMTDQRRRTRTRNSLRPKAVRDSATRRRARLDRSFFLYVFFYAFYGAVIIWIIWAVIVICS